MIYNRYDFTYDDMAALSDGQLLIRVYEDEGTASPFCASTETLLPSVQI